MGLVLKTTGASFEANAVAYIPPVVPGLRYWGFLNDSIEKLGKNFYRGGDDVSVVGIPSVSETHAVLNRQNYISTEVVQPRDFTLIAVGKPSATAVDTSNEQGMFISSHNAARPIADTVKSIGSSLYSASEDGATGTFSIQCRAGYYTGNVGDPNTASRSATLTGRDATKPIFVAGMNDSVAKKVSLHDITNGDSAESAPAEAGYVFDDSTGKYMIGSPIDKTFVSGDRDMYFAAIYDRVLTLSELNTIYAAVKKYLGNRGVVI